MEWQFEQADIDTAMRTISRLKLTYQQEQTVLRRIGRAVMKQSQKNIRAQRTIDGKAFAPRKGKGKRRKMLTKIMRKARAKTGANHVEIGWPNNVAGNIAYRQQHGEPAERWTAERAKRVRQRYENPNQNQQPPTRRMARVLLDAGFTLKKKRGKGRKRPSIKWVMENLKQGQLWAIFRELTDKPFKQQWEIENEARPFHGLTESQSQGILVNEVLQALERYR
ncbi:phage virion morphogenesis protein [Vibrio vulnificus]|uniref:phage virion morphogenesis protein n=1 Tax=Vibrio vulnificus TaxID=672 RepID=UPI00102A9162|nr:phage virion morphogenesis protein [Vibrio vulnificus]RZP88990.1 hypothetical protein D8T54_20400 [Vibrio vulnificus]